MSKDQNLFLKEQLLGEIWGDISSLNGQALDEYLTGIGLNPGVLLEDYAKGVDAASIASKRARFEEARHHVRLLAGAKDARIIALDLPKKRQIQAAIRERAARTNEMTIAARNQKIVDEQDLDSFLEACVRLGLIDEDGNLKE